MKSFRTGSTLVAAGGLVVVAGMTMASEHPGRAVMDVVTPEGVFTVPMDAAMLHPIYGLPGGGGVDGFWEWTFDLGTSIGETVSLSPDHTWAGAQLNNPRFLAFETEGFGFPIYEVDAGDSTPAGAAAARDVDRAAFLDRDGSGGPFRVRGYTSATSDADWEYFFPPNYNNSNSRMIAVSRDGAVVAAAARDTTLSDNMVVFLDANDGSVISTWHYPEGGLGGIDLTDDGSIAMVSFGNRPRVVDATTGTLIWAGTGSGAGNVDYRISGDGDVIVVGGFSLHVYQWDGFTYNMVINFTTPPTEWFGFGSTVSSDGSTVGAMSRESATNTLNVRLWDVASGVLTAEITLPPVAGTFQTSPRGADATDDGSLFAFATWADGLGIYPEIHVYDLDLDLVGEIHMPGSAWDVSISPDGEWVAGTGKAVHANVSGNGGQVSVLQLDVVSPVPCPGDLTGDGNVGVSDLLFMLSCWGPVGFGCEPADLTGDSNVGVADLLLLLGQWGPCP